MEEDLKWLPLRSSHIQRKNYFYFRGSGKSADFPEPHFYVTDLLGEFSGSVAKRTPFLYDPNCEKVAQKRPQAFLSHKL